VWLCNPAACPQQDTLGGVQTLFYQCPVSLQTYRSTAGRLEAYLQTSRTWLHGCMLLAIMGKVTMYMVHATM
jgi:hypothetical protein